MIKISLEYSELYYGVFKFNNYDIIVGYIINNNLKWGVDFITYNYCIDNIEYRDYFFEDKMHETFIQLLFL